MKIFDIYNSIAEKITRYLSYRPYNLMGNRSPLDYSSFNSAHGVYKYTREQSNQLIRSLKNAGITIRFTVHSYKSGDDTIYEIFRINGSGISLVVQIYAPKYNQVLIGFRSYFKVILNDKEFSSPTLPTRFSNITNSLATRYSISIHGDTIKFYINGIYIPEMDITSTELHDMILSLKDDSLFTDVTIGKEVL